MYQTKLINKIDKIRKDKVTYAWNDSSANQIEATAQKNEKCVKFHFDFANNLPLISYESEQNLTVFL